jgi:hypothetical protein
MEVPARRVGPRRRALLPLGLVALLATGLAGCALITPTGQSVSWRLSPATTETTRVVEVVAERPYCTNMAEGPWFADPEIVDTPLAVVITVRARPEFSGRPECESFFLSGTRLKVQLREPLGGRPLFDGSAMPPEARPYP